LIELSKEEFERMIEAKRRFIILLDIEEKFDIFIENYAEHEKELLSLTLRKSLFLDNNWLNTVSEIHIVNRRLANLLTTGRLYLDQVKQEIEEIYGAKSPLALKLEDHRNLECSNTPGFRLMKELRNYIQHRGLPVYRIDYPNKLFFSTQNNSEDTPTNRTIRWGITPSLSLEALKNDPKLTKSILPELESIGKYIPITPLVRQYVEAIGRLHKCLRDSTSNDSDTWIQLMKDAIERGRQHLQENVIGVSVAAENEQGDYVEAEQIFDDLMKRHEFLTNKNLCLPIISNQFVSGECIEDERLKTG
jgi:hypothetical protein